VWESQYFPLHVTCNAKKGRHKVAFSVNGPHINCLVRLGTRRKVGAISMWGDAEKKMPQTRAVPET
jgi:hypothetical protein